MTARQSAAFAAFRRVLDFLDRNLSRFTKINLAPQRDELRKIVARLTQIEIEQKAMPARRSQEAREADDLVEALRGNLGVVGAATRIIPHIVPPFRVPNSNAKIREVIVLSRVIADQIEGHEDALLKAVGMRETAADFRAGAAALEAYESAKKRGVGLGDEVKELVKAGMATVDVIESFMNREITPALAAEWKATRSLGRQHRPASKEKASVKQAETVAEPVPQRALTSGALPLLPLINRLETWVSARLATREPGTVDADYTVEDLTPQSKTP